MILTAKRFTPRFSELRSSWDSLSVLDSLPISKHSHVMCGIAMRVISAGVLLVGLLAAPSLKAQIPTTLTDKIYKGNGSINLLTDVNAASLQQYLTSSGGLLLGIDVNENEAGNETRDSLGLAIKQLELVIRTTAGTFSFNDFFTSTTAMIREAGAAGPTEFYTAFGRSGSSQITGGTDGFNLEQFDDVIRLRNVAFQGTLLSASLNVTFVTTADAKTQGNETFFDFSGGFEDFALLSQRDAALLEAANLGVAAAPSGVTYAAAAPTVTLAATTVPTTTVAATTTTPTAPAAPGAPVPPLVLLLAMGAVVSWKFKKHAQN